MDRIMEPSAGAAVVWSLAHGVLYVAAIYVSMALVRVEGASIHDRDHPHIIKRRMYGAGVATLLSLAISGLLLHRWRAQQGEGVPGVLALLGLDVRAALPSTIVSLVLVGLLFLGPLVLDNLDGVFAWDSLKRVPQSLWSQPECMRNYVVGPATEELVFRSAVVALWTAAGISTELCVLVSPVIFGVAHVHRAVSRYVSENIPLGSVVLSTVLQLAYTTVFGWIAAALFVRTHSVVGPIAAHVFCNVQGLPDPSRIANHPQYKYPIWLAFVAGLAGFLVLFEPMTRPGVFVPSLRYTKAL
ncbi:CAAX prenyl protease [Coemansia biformis]|uniref:intramembrane prenyl-peptidase Rce1 n=1 Tax=Coemansia biformis TaxID=1286918 RepID=A0A9W7YA90_9FUNG|nr:CAAX prenyl protease [Coemansia biformis]